MVNGALVMVNKMKRFGLASCLCALFVTGAQAQSDIVVSGVREDIGRGSMPDLNAALYPGGAKVECAVAVAVLTANRERLVDPMLRSQTHGDLDCRQTFEGAGITTRPYIAGSDEWREGTNEMPEPHLYLTRVVTAPSGRPYVRLSFKQGSFESGEGYEPEWKDGRWLVGDPVYEYIT